MGTMAKNKWTTLAGAIVACLVVLSQTPDLIPAGIVKYVNSLIGIATALGLYAAKDATTGSQPH